MILLFDRVERGKREAGRSFVPTAYFVGAYLAIWTAFGVLAFALAVVVDRLVTNAGWDTGRWARFGGILLIAAGASERSDVITHSGVSRAECTRRLVPGIRKPRSSTRRTGERASIPGRRQSASCVQASRGVWQK